MLGYYDRKDSLIVLGELDEAYSYEVDYTLVGIDKENGKFVLVTASGCSCWSGDYDEEQFDDLDAMEKSLLESDRIYNPSINGAKSLMAEAKTTFREICLKAFDS